MYPPWALLEYASIRRTFFCHSARTLPVHIVTTANHQIADARTPARAGSDPRATDGGRTATRRSNTVKPAILGTTDSMAAPAAWVPWNTSGA